MPWRRGRGRRPSGNQLDFPKNAAKMACMALPTEPVTLSVEQIRELNQKLSTLRHDVNGKLGLITLALGALQLKPEDGKRWMSIMGEQPQKIVADLTQFSAEIEAALRITRP